MKTAKIKGVPRHVCTVEQKIAYNIAFRVRLSCVDTFKALKWRADRIQLLHKEIRLLLRTWERDYCKKGGARYSANNARYNLDAIYHALLQGIEKYMQSDHFLLTDYTDIGNAFPIRY